MFWEFRYSEVENLSHFSDLKNERERELQSFFSHFGDLNYERNHFTHGERERERNHIFRELLKP